MTQAMNTKAEKEVQAANRPKRQITKPAYGRLRLKEKDKPVRVQCNLAWFPWIRFCNCRVRITKLWNYVRKIFLRGTHQHRIIGGMSINILCNNKQIIIQIFIWSFSCLFSSLLLLEVLDLESSRHSEPIIWCSRCRHYARSCTQCLPLTALRRLFFASPNNNSISPPRLMNSSPMSHQLSPLHHPHHPSLPVTLHLHPTTKWN